MQNTTNNSIANYVPIGRAYKNIDSLKRAIERKEAQLEKEHIKNVNAFANIGFGTNMRGYKRVSSLSYTKEDRLKEQLEVLQMQLKKLEFLQNT